MSNLERILDIFPAFDRWDPDPKKNYGIGSAQLRMLVKGPRGAIQFVCSTSWNLPRVQEELERKGVMALHGPRNPRLSDSDLVFMSTRPMGTDVGYHALEPQYEGHSPMEDKCEVLGGRTCYYDGSSLAAERIFALMVREGHEAVWTYLETEYRERFEEVDHG